MADRVRPLTDLARPRRWLPDFLTPAARPDADMADQLDHIAATPPDVVVQDLLATVPSRPLSPFGRALLADPAGLLPQLVEAVRVWYEEAIAPDWPRMRALLDADVAYRAAQLAEGGAGRLFEQLHPSLRWLGDRVVSDDPFERDFDLRGGAGAEPECVHRPAGAVEPAGGLVARRGVPGAGGRDAVGTRT
ncbi:hypothetical protein V2I01_11725 [Micromonospora sp. BRA006-A]|nr:hypothetical protein [Micromonospora sp. BRA006-A]